MNIRSSLIGAVVALCAFSVSITRAAELIVNGNFEIDFNTGWVIDSLEGMTPYYDTVDRAIDFHPDGDYEVRVKKYDAAYIRLNQTVDVPTTDLDFAVSAKLFAVEYNPAGSAFAAAAVILSYLNGAGTVLGETRIAARTPHCPWTNGATLHIIDAPDTNWHSYAFNVDDELANLPGVNPQDIAEVKVALFDTTDGC